MRRLRFAAGDATVKVYVKVAALLARGDAEKSVYVSLGVEWDKIRLLLPEADPADRDFEFFLDCHRNPPFRRAVEFGQDDAGDRGELVEDSSCVKRVLPDRRIEDEERFVRSVGKLLLADAAHFGQLLHEVGFRLEPSRRVDENDVGRFCLRRRNRVEGDS